MLSVEEKQKLEQEWRELSEKTKGEFINPADMRRMDEITSLLMTDGESATIKFNFIKGRGGHKGLNIKKGYNRKGPVS